MQKPIQVQSSGMDGWTPGPLAMLDEEAKTACIFLILDDENLD